MTGALIDQLTATPKTLAHLVAETSDGALDAAGPDGWSARTILAHLRDDEYLCMRVALERMLAEDDPELHFIAGADWEPRRNRRRDRKEHLLADFALHRQSSLTILRHLRDEDWERWGHAPDGRRFTVRHFLEAWAGHDRDHIAQLERALGETLGDVLQRRARMVDEYNERH